MTEIIIGCRACGLLRQPSVCFGLRHGGTRTTALTYFTKVIGDRGSVSMETSITVMATPETATGAADGVETASSTTPL